MVIKLYADGADIDQMHKVSKLVKGYTTNPTLMRKAGITNYRNFAFRAINAFPNHPISFEVFSDDFDEMERQAREISSWGENVYVKIPVCNTTGAESTALIARLSSSGVKVNVTAIMCYSQVDSVLDSLSMAPAVVSIFAGRIADTGRDPTAIINHALKRKKTVLHEILWASPRQVMDIYTADSLGCDIITCTPDLIAKMPLEGKNLLEYSKETVKMFYDDAHSAGYKL